MRENVIILSVAVYGEVLLNFLRHNNSICMLGTHLCFFSYKYIEPGLSFAV